MQRFAVLDSRSNRSALDAALRKKFPFSSFVYLDPNAPDDDLSEFSSLIADEDAFKKLASDHSKHDLVDKATVVMLDLNGAHTDVSLSSLPPSAREILASVEEPASADLTVFYRIPLSSDPGTELRNAVNLTVGDKLRAIADMYLTAEFARLGFKRNHLGYAYLKDAVMFCYFDSSSLHGKINSILYPKIAQKHNVSPASVERSLRTVIGYAYNNPGSHKQFKEFLGSADCPTNSEVIAALLERLSNYMLVTMFSNN